VPEHVLYTVVYGNVEDALFDLDTLEELHAEQQFGKFDAAVIDMQDGKPNIVRRVDRPHIRIIPEEFGDGGALPRQELEDAASELTADQAGLIVVGEPTIEKGFDEAIARSTQIVKRSVEASADEISSELQEALKR
jgi:hypothetical protein